LGEKPLVGCRGERDASYRFLSLSEDLEFKHRTAIESRVVNGQHDQFFTEVQPTVVLRIVICVELSGVVFGAASGVPVSIP